MATSNIELIRAIDAYKAAVIRNGASTCSECGHQRDSLNVELAGRGVLKALRDQVREDLRQTSVSMSP